MLNISVLLNISMISPLIVIPSRELVINITGGDASNQDRQEASEEAGHSMEVVNSAGVMNLELFQKKWLQIILSQDLANVRSATNKT